MSLPAGPLVAWLGDDFTGGAAVAETLVFAGLPAAMFLDPPTPTMLARFPGLRGIGLATTARAEPPAWMDEHLPSLYAALVATGAAMTHYKACSTMDSAPHTGSLGRALELGLAATGETCAPILFASPEMGRFQAFGTLFAAGSDGIHRIDRHPVMARHPITPIKEADVCRHLAQQTDLPLAALMRPDLTVDRFEKLASDGWRGIAVDCAGTDDLVAVGRLLWGRRFVLGSQGVESALLSYFRAAGWLPENASHMPTPTPVDQIAVVSGSASAATARQIAWAESKGWPVIRLDTSSLFGAGGDAAVSRATDAALSAWANGYSPIVAAVRGPDDPALAETRKAMTRGCPSRAEGEARIGEALGAVLATLVSEGVPRVLVAGGDTSGRVARALGLFAIEPWAWIAHGASLQRGHKADGTTVEIILKGGQMGPEDLFERALGVRTETGREVTQRLPQQTTKTNPKGGSHDYPHHAA